MSLQVDLPELPPHQPRENSAEWFAQKAAENRANIATWPAYLRDAPVYSELSAP